MMNFKFPITIKVIYKVEREKKLTAEGHFEILTLSQFHSGKEVFF